MAAALERCDAGRLCGFKALYCSTGVKYCGIPHAFPEEAELATMASAGWCVMHLVRRNAVAQAISAAGAGYRMSHLNMSATHAHHCIRGQRCAIPSFSLPVTSLLDVLGQNARQREAISARLSHHATLRSTTVVYEDLLDCLDAPLHFLGLNTNVTLRASLTKVHARPPSNLLSNFEAVARALNGTGFAGDLERLERGAGSQESGGRAKAVQGCLSHVK